VTTGSVYLGDGWLVEVRLADGQQLRVRVNEPRQPIPRPGDQVSVTWDPADGRVLPT
jgi:hypothetical protein